jgi:LPXTG-motif cell wall-anchored protein
MKKIAATGSVLAAVALSVFGAMGAAQAADGDSSTTDVSPPQLTPNDTTVQSEDVSDNSADAPSSAATLPNTGGPNELLLGGAVALALAGGTTMVVARRRQTS